MKICLRDPGYQQCIGQELGVSQATVSRTVDRVVNSIVAQSNEWIMFLTTNHELMKAKRIWQSMYKFPTAISVIDCTHIGILKPNRHGDEYINRKGKATLNVQVTFDARETFTSVEASWPGSVHDSRIWRNSQTRSQLISKANVLGDDGYAIEPCLITPFRNPTPGAEINYNKLLKQERAIIERCFGQLKRWFPILQYVCCVKWENVLKIIIACIVLHNVAKSLGDPDIELVEQDPDEDEGNHEND
ncbi:unnamed protein product [Acanthoscelides obtectus]|uniref:Putative nuclease HARBI1 n=1 Tax=Acanthoscelides obtectus TaxID=200917 RepID=A0A9P0KUP8_ACAOB|nr:unnamed protein product [Acanthoscelides obtectus]CAK1685058.1 Putative nuclease HARBI1 [Acanthoscelides obtectus]